MDELRDRCFEINGNEQSFACGGVYAGVSDCVAAPLLHTALQPYSCSKSGVARNTACRRTLDLFA